MPTFCIETFFFLLVLELRIYNVWDTVNGGYVYFTCISIFYNQEVSSLAYLKYFR